MQFRSTWKTQWPKAQGRSPRGGAQFLRSPQALESGKLIIVRVNAIGLAAFRSRRAGGDAQPALALLNLPKAESAADIIRCCAALARAESPTAWHAPMRILANIESPAGCAARPRSPAPIRAWPACSWALPTCSKPTALPAATRANVHVAMFALRMAAAEAGVFALRLAPSPISATPKATARKRAWRAGWASGARAASTPARWRWPTTASPQRRRDSRRACAWWLPPRDAAKQGRRRLLVEGRMIDLPFARAPPSSRAARSAERRARPNRRDKHPESQTTGRRGRPAGRHPRARPERLHRRPLRLHAAGRPGRRSDQDRAARRRQPAQVPVHAGKPKAAPFSA
jgi:citrate lyase subunit beta/citryl-CoA lyase